MPRDADMDAIALLKADHRKVEGLFEKYESAKGAAKKQALVEQICTELCIHAAIEEEIFYPACKGEVKKEVLDEAYVEHDGAKVLIAELMAGKPSDAFYDAKVKVLSELIKHHVKEEEQRSEGLFAEARQAGLDMSAVGEALRQRKTELKAEFAAKGLPKPATRTYTGHELAQSRPIDKAA